MIFDHLPVQCKWFFSVSSPLDKSFGVIRPVNQGATCILYLYQCAFPATSFDLRSTHSCLFGGSHVFAPHSVLFPSVSICVTSQLLDRGPAFRNYFCMEVACIQKHVLFCFYFCDSWFFYSVFCSDTIINLVDFFFSPSWYSIGAASLVAIQNRWVKLCDTCVRLFPLLPPVTRWSYPIRSAFCDHILPAHLSSHAFLVRLFNLIYVIIFLFYVCLSLVISFLRHSVNHSLIHQANSLIHPFIRLVVSSINRPVTLPIGQLHSFLPSLIHRMIGSLIDSSNQLATHLSGYSQREFDFMGTSNLIFDRCEW